MLDFKEGGKMKQGDTWKDLKAYIHFRIEHISLERQKIPFTIEESKRSQVYNKLTAKMNELKKLKTVVNGNIKENSKYEYNKVKHLNKMKIAHLKGDLPL